MFSNSRAFSSFSVDDIEAARRFYGQTLGLEASVNEIGFLDLTLPGGARVFVYPKPDHQPASYTVLNFMVDDIDRAVDDLVAAGVPMQHYDAADIATDERGIARGEYGPPIAWFTDPARNVIAVMEEPAGG